jgi:single-strand DNA-binding protein
VLWRGLAEVVEKYVKKGSKLFIEGKITSRQYEKDGVTKYFTEIVANNMVMLDSKPSGGSSDNPSEVSTTASVTPTPAVSEPKVDDSGADDDLPF